MMVKHRSVAPANGIRVSITPPGTRRETIMENSQTEGFMEVRSKGPGLARSQYSNNRLHCEDGPALVWADGNCEYWLHGTPVSFWTLWDRLDAEGQKRLVTWFDRPRRVSEEAVMAALDWVICEKSLRHPD